MISSTIINDAFFVLETIAFYNIQITDINELEYIYGNGTILIFLLVT